MKTFHHFSTRGSLSKTRTLKVVGSEGTLGLQFVSFGSSKHFIDSTQVHLALSNIRAPSLLINRMHPSERLSCFCNVIWLFVRLAVWRLQRCGGTGTVTCQVLIKRVLVCTALKVSLSRKVGMKTETYWRKQLLYKSKSRLPDVWLMHIFPEPPWYWLRVCRVLFLFHLFL